MQYVSSTPATRLDVTNLQEQLDQKLQQRQARETGICPVREELYSQCFGEPMGALYAGAGRCRTAPRPRGQRKGSGLGCYNYCRVAPRIGSSFPFPPLSGALALKGGFGSIKLLCCSMNACSPLDAVKLTKHFVVLAVLPPTNNLLLLRVLHQHARHEDELIRQVTINCAERGLLLLRVRDEIHMTIAAYQTMYESSIAFGIRKALIAEQRKAEMEAKVSTKRSRAHPQPPG